MSSRNLHHPMAVLPLLALAGMLSTPASAHEIEKLVPIEHATSDATVDNGAAGDSAGDLLTFANEVFDQDNKTKVGSDNGWCIRTVAGQAYECFWTLTLADGQITVQGPFYDAKDSVLSITGGTGKYTHARGEMALHARNAEGSEYDFVYSIAE